MTTTSRDHRGGIRGISPIKIDGRHGDDGVCEEGEVESRALQALRRRGYLREMSFGAAVSLIEIDYPGAGSDVFPRRRVSTSTDHPHLPFTPFRGDEETASRLPGRTRSLARSLCRSSDIHISRREALARITLRSKSFSPSQSIRATSSPRT